MGIQRSPCGGEPGDKATKEAQHTVLQIYMYSLYRKESKNSKLYMHGSLYKTHSVVVVKCEGHVQQELTPVNPKEWSVVELVLL